MSKYPKLSHFPELSTRHLNAIDYLVASENIENTAEKVGVNRRTISRWLNENPVFIAALNAKRQEVWGAAHEQIRSMVPTAINVLKKALDNSDPKIAIEVLKAANIYGNVPAPQGKTDPASIMLNMAEKQASDKICLASKGDPQKEATLLMDKLPSLTEEIYKSMLINVEKYADDNDSEETETIENSETSDIALPDEDLNSELDINSVLLDAFAKMYLSMRKNQSAEDVTHLLNIANYLAKQGNNMPALQEFLIQLQTTTAPTKSIDDLFEEVKEDDI